MELIASYWYGPPPASLIALEIVLGMGWVVAMIASARPLLAFVFGGIGCMMIAWRVTTAGEGDMVGFYMIANGVTFGLSGAVVSSVGAWIVRRDRQGRKAKSKGE